jgi:methionyl aminopeptidase
MYTKVKTAEEIEAMRVSGKMLATVLEKTISSAKPGMTTMDLANIAKEELRVLGGQPAFLGYQGFPNVLCTSVNDEIVHGIPSDKKVLKDGDIVSLDFGVTYKGMITDSARSFIVGKPRSSKDVRLLDSTRISLEAGIEAIRAGIKVGQISNAVESVLKPAGYGIVRDLVGHGVGHQLHEEPNIPNHGPKSAGPVLEAGMTIAVEPMATMGDYKVKTDEDGWTIRTVDGSRSAHFEHTILITEDGYEVLTTLN